eukprot:gene11223-biopygen9021
MTVVHLLVLVVVVAAKAAGTFMMMAMTMRMVMGSSRSNLQHYGNELVFATLQLHGSTATQIYNTAS